MNILFVASEAAPFAKTGGLGEVIGSLPKALREQGIDARVIIPKYRSIPQELRSNISYKKHIFVKLGWRHQYCGLEETIYQGVPIYFIDNEYYFGRDMMYGYEDDEPERYTFFCRSVLEVIPYLGFIPDIIHCHDWQTGIIPILLEAHYRHLNPYWDIRTVFTIHNLRYQGIFSKNVLTDLLDLGFEYFSPDKIEFYGDVNFMKAGLTYANLISTVSPSYAREIQTPYFGMRLDGLLRARHAQLFGILNGIDSEAYNPSIDPLIFENYDYKNLKGKMINKKQLQKTLNLPVKPDTPIIAVISRLVSQKGIDLIACVLEEILSLDLQLVVLGNGEWQYENLFRDAANRHKDKVSANIYYDNTMAHRIYAGADMFLMPSMFEPCGLSQLFSMRYGTIPIVRETGGLRDTVIPYNEFTREGNGFSFTNYNAHDMLYTIRRALNFYYDKKAWDKLVIKAMNRDYSWSRSAKKYIELYSLLV